MLRGAKLLTTLLNQGKSLSYVANHVSITMQAQPQCMSVPLASADVQLLPIVIDTFASARMRKFRFCA